MAEVQTRPSPRHEEFEARDRYVTAHVENDCDGCVPDFHGTWTPAQDCPVHGEFFEQWWNSLNERCRRLFPMTYGA